MFSSTRSLPVYTYQNLLSAIRRKDAAEVSIILNAYPHYLNIVNAVGDTILHTAVNYSTTEIVTLITARIKKSNHNLSEFAARKNKLGWSTLHLACFHATEDTIMHIINCLNEADCRQLLQDTPNDSQYIPAVMLFNRNPHSQSRTVKDRILSLSCTEYDIHLSDLLDPDTVLQQLTPAQENAGMSACLVEACAAVNNTRQTLIVSDTHFDSNTLPIDSKHSHYTFIHQLRETSMITMTKPVTQVMQWTALTHYVKYCEKFSIGNCVEFAYLTAYQLIKKGIPNIEVMAIANGDHAFLVANRETGSKIADYTTWGANAYVIDAWAGNIYPASEIPAKLPCYYRVVTDMENPSSSAYNLRGKFNPNIHSTELDLSFSNTFVSAISELYQTLPRLEELLNRNQLQHAIHITCECLRHTCNSLQDGIFFISTNPLRETINCMIENMQTKCNLLDSDDEKTFEAFTMLLSQFIHYTKNPDIRPHPRLTRAFEETLNRLNSGFGNYQESAPATPKSATIP